MPQSHILSETILKQLISDNITPWKKCIVKLIHLSSSRQLHMAVAYNKNNINQLLTNGKLLF